MSLFNWNKKPKNAPDSSADLDGGVPDMSQQDTASILAQRAAQQDAQQQADTADIRAREYGPGQADDIESSGVPSVNRRSGGNKLVTALGFIFILGAATAMIVAVNSGDKEPKAKTPAASDKVANNLPPIAIPAPPPPPIPAPAAAPIATSGGKPAPIAVAPTAQAPRPATATKQPLHWSDRKMMGEILADGVKGSGAAQATRVAATSEAGVSGSGGLGGFGASQPADRGGNALGDALRPTQTNAAQAGMLGDRNFLITKGTALDCALETALDSSVPGLTTCRLTRDVYSDNGQVLLLDRGSTLVGEYQGGMKQGQVRLFVLWTRAKTPNGVVVNLNSPGTDALGRSGHDGWVNNHFWKRFGAAIMMSLIGDSIKIVANESGGGSGSTNNYYGSTANEGGKIVEKVLESTVNIPPTIIKNQGDHIQVMVARDLDFSSVYALEVKE